MLLKSIVLVSLTKSCDTDKIMLHEYYLHNKGRIGQRHKDYYNNNKKRFRSNSKNKSPQGRVERFLHFTKRGPTFICVVLNRRIDVST